MGITLGISAYFHDSAVAAVRNGEILMALQEERLSRIRHDAGFPYRALRMIQERLNLGASDLEAIVFYEKPLLVAERVAATYVQAAPRGFDFFAESFPQLAGKTLLLKDRLHREICRVFPDFPLSKLAFSRHHLSHAASAFLPSPFAESAILTLDGVGEWETVFIGRGEGQQITQLASMNFPNSLGLFFSSLTQFLGFKVDSGEYKVMGLAGYGDANSPNYQHLKRILRDEVLRLNSDGSVELNPEHFVFSKQARMIEISHWEDLLKMPARRSEALVTREQATLALAGQEVLQEAVLGLAQTTKRLTNSKSLCLAGGVALNCVANRALKLSGLFEDIWIQPAAGDAGGALGAALIYDAFETPTARPHVARGEDALQASALGPDWSSKDIESQLLEEGAKFRRMTDTQALLSQVASWLDERMVVGWFQGRMEWGPRALGFRSILASAFLPETQSRLALKIKKRESFRPFAPAVQEEAAGELCSEGFRSPYMLLVDHIHPQWRKPKQETQSLNDDIHAIRSRFPAVTHSDYSCRVQTVSRNGNPLFWKLLEAIKHRQGFPIVVNTSFNERGEPIVCSPRDAFRCFMNTEMDFLVVGDFVLDRREQSVPTATRTFAAD